MKDKFVLKPCPHCGGEATLASPDQWSYLSCIVFCPSCLAKGPQGDDYANAIAGWMYRLGTQYPAAVDAVAKACPYCASEKLLKAIMVWVMNLDMRVLCSLRHAQIV